MRRGLSPQAGDVLLVYRGSGVFDRLVRFATVSPFFHAAMLTGGNGGTEIIEAALGGVRYNDLSAYAGRADVLEVRGATAAQRRDAVHFAKDKLMLPYGWRAIVADALRLGLHVNVGYRWRTWHHYDCSCLVANAWANAGVPLTFAPAPSPADLGWSPVLVGPRPWAEPAAISSYEEIPL
jgi:uncharacterized protein YycO